MLDAAQRAALDRYFAAMQSGGARVLANATQARKILAADAPPAAVAEPVEPPTPVGSAPVAPSPVSLPGASLFPAG